MKVPDPAPPENIRGLTFPALHVKWTREGQRMFRECRIPLSSDHAFQQSWRTARRAWLERGFSLRNESGGWVVQQWLVAGPEGYQLTPSGIERLANTYTQSSLQLKEAVPELILSPLSAEIEGKLRGYQVAPARQLHRAIVNGRAEWGYSGAVDLSDMGVGKTYMALGAALQTGRQVCVLCPSVGQGGWSRAFAHFGAEPYFIGTYEAVRGSWRENIVSADSTGKFTWKNPSSIVLILDEAQALRHDDTLTTRCCAAAIRQGVPIIIASATVATSPLEMRFAGRITGLHNGDDDWRRFLSDHGCVKSGESWKWDGRIDHLKRIHGRLFPRRGCRVRKEDLGEECPETRIEVLRVDVPEGARLQKEWRDVADLIERLEKQRAPKQYIVTARRKARMAAWKACEMALVEPIAKLAKDDMQNGRSVAIFMNFNETRMRMGDLIGSHDGFYGGQPIKHRQQLERDFQANRIFSLVSNIGAGGASVSLQDLTGDRPRSAYIFPTDDVVKVVQATGRVDRTLGKTLSLQYIVCVRGAMTEEIVQRTRRKMGAIDSVNDGYKAAGGRF